MREVNCLCGLLLTGTDDRELDRLAHEHVAEHHAGGGITDEFIADHIAKNARDAVPS